MRQKVILLNVWTIVRNIVFFMVNKLHILTYIHIFMNRCIFINLKSYKTIFLLIILLNCIRFFSRNDRFFSTFAFGIFIVNSNFTKFQKCCHLFKAVLNPAGQQTRNFLTHLKCKGINLSRLSTETILKQKNVFHF